jgi:uncharacterized membrane protein
MFAVGVLTALVGFLLSLTGIGLVIGIPLFMVGLYRIYKSSNATVEAEYWL